jgi:hypothetical protein
MRKAYKCTVRSSISLSYYDTEQLIILSEILGTVPCHRLFSSSSFWKLVLFHHVIGKVKNPPPLATWSSKYRDYENGS